MGQKEKVIDSDPEELVAEEDDKNWKGICIAVLVISTIISLIFLAIHILTPKESGDRITHPRLSLEDIISPQFQPEEFTGSWVSDHELILPNKRDGSLMLFNVVDNTTVTIIPNTTMRQYQVQRYSMSPDKRYVLLVHDIRRIHHYGHVSKYKVFNVSNEHVTNIEGPNAAIRLQHASWGPKGNQMIFVSDNNMYYIPEIGATTIPLTTSGRADGSISNGVPDWLYGERVLKTDHVYWFSPLGNKVAFISFDDTRVAETSYPKFGSYDDPNNMYPSIATIRFPKAGKINPEVTLQVIDLRSPSESKRIRPPADIISSDHYFTSFVWIEEEKVAAIWMKREQNYSLVSLCSQDKNWECEKHLQERSEGDSSGWVELFDPPLITSDKRHYLLRLPMNDGDSGSFRQIAMITINGRVKNFLTQGTHDVTRILGHDSDTRTVFYEGTAADDPAERHIYSIPDIHSTLARNPKCLTCNHVSSSPSPSSSSPSSSPSAAPISPSDSSPSYATPYVHDPTPSCSYHRAIFSPGAKYYVLLCEGPGQPWTQVWSVQSDAIVMGTTLDTKVTPMLKERAFPHFKHMRIPLDPTGTHIAEVLLTLPPGMRESEFYRFPLILEILPEPGEQSVTQKLHINWGKYLASKRDFIYAQIDVRGSRNSGDLKLHTLRHKLGQIEVDDYLTIMEYLRSHLHFIDLKRVAVWGWSYGGFIAATLLAHDRNSFNCGISVAPVTNWLYADSFTSERYFGHPWGNGNFVRYEKSDLIHKAIHFQDRNLFLIHGTADDSVHLQNSFAFMKSLNDMNVIYKSQIYPDSNHHLEDVRYHLYRSMETYLLECFKLKEGQDIMEMQGLVRLP